MKTLICLAALVCALAAHGAADADSVSYQYVRHGAPAYSLLTPYYRHHPGSRLTAADSSYYPAGYYGHGLRHPAGYGYAHHPYHATFRHRIHKRAVEEQEAPMEDQVKAGVEAVEDMPEADLREAEDMMEAVEEGMPQADLREAEDMMEAVQEVMSEADLRDAEAMMEAEPEMEDAKNDAPVKSRSDLTGNFVKVQRFGPASSYSYGSSSPVKYSYSPVKYSYSPVKYSYSPVRYGYKPVKVVEKSEEAEKKADEKPSYVKYFPGYTNRHYGFNYYPYGGYYGYPARAYYPVQRYGYGYNFYG